MLIFRLIEKSISAAYDIIRQSHLQNFGTPSGAGIDSMDTSSSLGHRSFIDLPKELFQMLAITGPYLYRDTILLQKVYNYIFSLYSLNTLNFDIIVPFIFFILF